jgi:ribulose-phosphate 3-epimerase
MTTVTGQPTRPSKLSASVMCANFLNLGADMINLKRQGIGFLHFDIMDGHFVPEVGLGIFILEQITRAGQLPVDVHLMVTDPGRYIDPLIGAGASLICIHQEVEEDVPRLLGKIRKQGCKAGLALRPETNLASAIPALDALDMVLLMAYAPGIRNQKAVLGFERRIGETLGLLARHNRLATDIAVDGGVSLAHLRTYSEAGANFFILGSSGLFIPGTELPEQIDRIKRILQEPRIDA